MSRDPLADLVAAGVETLSREDPTLHDMLEREYERQCEVLTMVAASSIVDPSVLVAESSLPVNVTAEGYPGARFHAGCRVIDEIESLAIERAKRAFRARYANVQAHSATTANQVVMCALLRPGDTLLGLELDSGGHLTHGAKPSLSGQYFNAIGYGLGEDGSIDYDGVRELAHEHRPRLIICGTTAYPRVIDFERFRAIADEVDAILLADITHIAGLVIAGLHPSSIDHAHVTTTCTHKQIYGPRGGLILMGRDYDRPLPGSKRTLSAMAQKGVFPFFQGAPKLNSIAAKARALGRVLEPGYKTLMQRIVDDARALADTFTELGYRVITGGTDNHLVVIDVGANGVSGLVAERALEDCHIVVNKNRIPGDQKPPMVTSGVRIGTNSMALRAMGPDIMPRCARLVHRVLTAVEPKGDRDFDLAPEVRLEVRAAVREICDAYPIGSYPLSVEQARAAAADPVGTTT
jgi:glycine hydroxymethyltransferase